MVEKFYEDWVGLGYIEIVGWLVCVYKCLWFIIVGYY